MTKNNQHDAKFAALDYDKIAAAMVPPATAERKEGDIINVHLDAPIPAGATFTIEGDPPRAVVIAQSALRPDSPVLQLLQGDSVVTVDERRAQWDEYLAGFVPRASVAPVEAVQTTPDAIKTAVMDALTDAIGSCAYDCTRVWSAWQCGTMSDDDFVSIADDEDRIADIADAAINAIALHAPAVQGEAGKAKKKFLDARGEYYRQRYLDLLNRVEADALAAPADPVQGVATADERAVIEAILEVAYRAWSAMDNSEEDDGFVCIERPDIEALSRAMDVLDALPDDRPGYVMKAAAKARWALRGLLASVSANTSADGEAA